MSDMRMKHVFYLFFVGVLLAPWAGAEDNTGTVVDLS